MPKPDILEGRDSLVSARPVLAIEEDLETMLSSGSPTCLHMVLLYGGVFLTGLVSGLIGAKQDRFGQSDTWVGLLILTLLVFSVINLPLILAWVRQLQRVQQLPPESSHRRMLVVAFWSFFSLLAFIAAFVLFVLACSGGARLR